LGFNGGWGIGGGQYLRNSEGLERKSVVKEYLIGGVLCIECIIGYEVIL
jgi:hypothetical protein